MPKMRYRPPELDYQPRGVLPGRCLRCFSGQTRYHPWDTRNATTFRSMFQRATSARPETRYWQTREVRNMAFMFDERAAPLPEVGPESPPSRRCFKTRSWRNLIPRAGYKRSQ